MPITILDIYNYMKDRPELNVLLRGKLQSQEADIDLAMRMAADSFNMTAPVTAYSVEGIPSSAALLYGTLHHLANGEAERQLRNQTTYSAQGMNAAIDDKFQQYNTLASFYLQLFERETTKCKAFINAEQAWGGSYSPYAAINERNFRS